MTKAARDFFLRAFFFVNLFVQYIFNAYCMSMTSEHKAQKAFNTMASCQPYEHKVAQSSSYRAYEMRAYGYGYMLRANERIA